MVEKQISILENDYKISSGEMIDHPRREVSRLTAYLK